MLDCYTLSLLSLSLTLSIIIIILLLLLLLLFIIIIITVFIIIYIINAILEEKEKAIGWEVGFTNKTVWTCLYTCYLCTNFFVCLFCFLFFFKNVFFRIYNCFCKFNKNKNKSLLKRKNNDFFRKMYYPSVSGPQRKCISLNMWYNQGQFRYLNFTDYSNLLHLFVIIQNILG